MLKDRLEISSPGSFYQGEKIGKTYDLSKIISKRRNELICGILVKCNVMEAAGTGFDKITQEYMDADEHHRPYIYSASDHFTLVLPDLTYSEGVITDDAENVEFVPVPNGTPHDEKILSFCYNTARKAGAILTAEFFPLLEQYNLCSVETVPLTEYLYAVILRQTVTIIHYPLIPESAIPSTNCFCSTR